MPTFRRMRWNADARLANDDPTEKIIENAPRAGAGLADDEAFSAEFRLVDRLAPGEGMIRRGDDDLRVLAEIFAGDLKIDHGTAHHREINRIVAEKLNDFSTIAHRD